MDTPTRIWPSDIRHNQFSVNWNDVKQADSYFVKLYEQGQHRDYLENKKIRDYVVNTNYLSPVGLKEATYYKVEIFVIDYQNRTSADKSTKSEILTLGTPPVVFGCTQFLCEIEVEDRELTEPTTQPVCEEIADGNCWVSADQRKGSHITIVLHDDLVTVHRVAFGLT